MIFLLKSTLKNSYENIGLLNLILVYLILLYYRIPLFNSKLIG